MLRSSRTTSLSLAALCILPLAGGLFGAARPQPVDPAVPGPAAPKVDVTLSVDPDKVVGPVHEFIYGHFYEHIYHSANGGLWGEMVWNRSFEEITGGGAWRVSGQALDQTGMATNLRYTFGDASWADYEFTLEAQKTGGNEGFLVLFRVKNDKEFTWCNLGGWRNQRHGLERGVKGQQRWGSIGKSVTGSITKGRWYRIRVRCEGRRFQVWLDDKKLFDFTDDEKAHLRGKVGVGTWSTQAKFRNLKVTSLDGKILHEGLPKRQSTTAVSRFWESYGQGRFEQTDVNPLNSHACMHVVSTGGEAGLKQTPLRIRKGETYRGSVWVRGTAPGGMVVRLLDGEKTLAEMPLPDPTARWESRAILLMSKAGADNATLQVGVSAGGDVCIDQVSLTPDAAAKAGGFRPDLLKAIAGIRPPIIRWPGGCFASPYRWKHAIGPQHKRMIYPRTIWDDRDVNSLGTDEFVDLCRRVGAEPLIVINIGSKRWNPGLEDHDFLQEALDWIEYCNGPATSKWGKVRAANGRPKPYNVTYWEIDNETWHMGDEAYAAAVNRFGPAMRKADPSITLLACGSGGYRQDWNRTVINQAGKNFDYISTHHYEGPDNYASGPPKDEAFYRELKEIIATSPNSKIKVYCSEWNAQSTDWRTGLYAGGILNVFERCGDFFEIGGPALFLRHTSAEKWDNAFINFDHRTWFPAPNYVVMKLWRDHYAPHRIQLTGEPGGLNVVATKSADGKAVYLKVVNPTGERLTVKLDVGGAFRPGKATLKLVAPGSLDARNTLAEPGAVRAVDAPVVSTGRSLAFTLPPLSAGVVTVRAK